MKNEENVKISGQISSLKPYLDENGIIRVGGRLEKSDINNDCKHPILMQKYCHILASGLPILTHLHIF